MTTEIEVQNALGWAANRAAVSSLRSAAARSSTAGRREFTALVAVGVAISAWALFPSTLPSGQYVPLPEAPARPAVDVFSATKADGGRPETPYRLINAKQEPLSNRTASGSAPLRYSGSDGRLPQVSLRSKLQTLLLLVRSSTDSWSALEAKLEALLRLPDVVLIQLMQHPGLADLREALDAVFAGGSDLASVVHELGRIEVTTVPGETAQIDVIKVNGEPTLIVRTAENHKGVKNAAGAPASAAAPSGPVTVTVVSELQRADVLSVISAAVAPSVQPLAPAPEPAAEPAIAYELAPSAALSSFSQPTPEMSPSFTALPEPSPSQAPPAPPPESTEEPQAPPNDVMTSGNKFEPGDTVAPPSDGDGSPVTATDVPSSSPVNQEPEPPTVGGDPTPGGEVSTDTSQSSESQTAPQ